MINKNKFTINNTKKVLHKVGKQWVTVSVALLGLIGAGIVATHASADTTATAAKPAAVRLANNYSTAQNNQISNANANGKTTTPRGVLPANLKNADNGNQPANINKNYVQNYNNQAAQSNQQNNSITNQAKNLHSHILNNDTNNSNHTSQIQQPNQEIATSPSINKISKGSSSPAFQNLTDIINGLSPNQRNSFENIVGSMNNGMPSLKDGTGIEWATYVRNHAGNIADLVAGDNPFAQFFPNIALSVIESKFTNDFRNNQVNVGDLIQSGSGHWSIVKSTLSNHPELQTLVDAKNVADNNSEQSSNFSKVINNAVNLARDSGNPAKQATDLGNISSGLTPMISSFPSQQDKNNANSLDSPNGEIAKEKQQQSDKANDSSDINNALSTFLGSNTQTFITNVVKKLATTNNTEKQNFQNLMNSVQCNLKSDSSPSQFVDGIKNSIDNFSSTGALAGAFRSAIDSYSNSVNNKKNNAINGAFNLVKDDPNVKNAVIKIAGSLSDISKQTLSNGKSNNVEDDLKDISNDIQNSPLSSIPVINNTIKSDINQSASDYHQQPAPPAPNGGGGYTPAGPSVPDTPEPQPNPAPFVPSTDIPSVPSDNNANVVPSINVTPTNNNSIVNFANQSTNNQLSDVTPISNYLPTIRASRKNPAYVVLTRGTYEYAKTIFNNKTRRVTLHIGDIVPVKRIFHIYGITRMQLINGLYVTSNKRYVETLTKDIANKLVNIANRAVVKAEKHVSHARTYRVRRSAYRALREAEARYSKITKIMASIRKNGRHNNALHNTKHVSHYTRAYRKATKRTRRSLVKANKGVENAREALRRHANYNNRKALRRANAKLSAVENAILR